MAKASAPDGATAGGRVIEMGEQRLGLQRLGACRVLGAVERTRRSPRHYGRHRSQQIVHSVDTSIPDPRHPWLFIYAMLAGRLAAQMFPPPYVPGVSEGRGLDLRGVGFFIGSWIGALTGVVCALITVGFSSIVRRLRESRQGVFYRNTFGLSRN